MKVSNDSNFETPPNGTHLARCIRLIDVGTHTDTYQGKDRTNRKIVVVWELPYEQMSDGQPFVISKFYTASLGDKANLRRDLMNWRGRDFTPEELKGFEMKNVLDKGCQVIVSQNDNGRTIVSGVAGMPKGVELPERHNPLVYFALDDEWDDAAFSFVSEGLQKMIKDSQEYAAFHADVPPQEPPSPSLPPNTDDSEEDGIPF